MSPFLNPIIFTNLCGLAGGQYDAGARQRSDPTPGPATGPREALPAYAIVISPPLPITYFFVFLRAIRTLP